MRYPILVLALLLSACLPTPVGRDAGVGELDSGPAPIREPPKVVALEVLDVSGAAWPPDGIPRQPRVHVALSDAPFEDSSGPPVWLLTGAPDDSLLEDLAASPLRVANRARAVEASIDPTSTGWVITPRARLEPGARFTVAIGAWLRGQSTGLRMGTPYAAELAVSDAPTAGAAVVASWPADGAAGVPRALPAIAVRFDGLVSGVSEGLTLHTAHGPVPGRARTTECAAEGWPDGWCAIVVPDSPLAPGEEHVVEVDARDATGAPVGPWTARFRTALDDHDEPPALSPLSCALDEQALEGLCVLADDGRLVVRLQATEPVRVSLTVAGRALLDVAPRGSATLSATDLAPAASFAAVLRLEDLAGTVLEHALALETTEPLATLSIVEVRSDPLGPEPRQEYVEVLNYGTMSVDLSGLSLSDHPSAVGDVVPRAERLAPGQRALLVADDFDPEDPADPPVPPGVPLVRMGRSLASSGLSNAGEPVFLRDVSMRRLSAVPAVSTGAGRCLVRTGDDLRGDAAALFTVGPCTPGVGP